MRRRERAIEEFEPKDPAEVWPITFDFSRDLRGDPVDGAEWTIIPVVGSDSQAGNMLVGAPEWDETSSTQHVRGGVSGVKYLIKCSATAGLAKLSNAAYFTVKPLGSP